MFNRKHISFSILYLHQNCEMLLLLILDEVFRWPNIREAKSHLMTDENILAFKIKALVAAFGVSCIVLLSPLEGVRAQGSFF